MRLIPRRKLAANSWLFNQYIDTVQYSPLSVTSRKMADPKGYGRWDETRWDKFNWEGEL